MSIIKEKIRAFAISRALNAPRIAVWDAFTKPERLKRWWGPKGFVMRVSWMDFRPGGIYHYCLRSPDGIDIWGKLAYREIAPPERIVAINSFSNEKGELTRHPLVTDWPREMLSTFMFKEADGQYILTIERVPLNPAAEERAAFENGRDAMTKGWTGTLDQLDAYLKSESLLFVEEKMGTPVEEIQDAAMDMENSE